MGVEYGKGQNGLGLIGDSSELIGDDAVVALSCFVCLFCHVYSTAVHSSIDG